MRIVALDPAARACGLAVGITLSDARALVPDLLVYDHDATADAELLDHIADGCMRYTPMVMVEPPDGIMLDITGTAHLHGSEAALAKSVQAWLQERRITVRHACAFSAEAAHALARFHSGAIADEMAAIRALPVAALHLDPERDLGLRRAGLKTIGDVAERPREVIAARFGTDCIYRLERLLGASARPLRLRAKPAPHIVRRRFAEPIASSAYAVKVLGGLLEEANIALAEKDLGGRAFEARFHRIDGLVRHLNVETGRPTRDAAAIARLFDERIDSLSDPLDPGFGFDSVELAILRTDPLKAVQDTIERPAADDDRTLAEKRARTLDILAVRLGRNRLLRFRSNDTHRPESGQIAVPALALASAADDGWPLPSAGDPPMRPLHLFDPPQHIAVIAEIPDGPPRRFRWRGQVRDIVLHEGPERIAAEWWTSPQDPLGRDQLTRDYYRIEDRDGRRYWVFRHGLYGRESDDPHWYLHGLFA